MKPKVILADPPWSFKTYSQKGMGRSAAAHYDCMELKEIMNYGVHLEHHEDCVLLMWAIDPMLPQAIETMGKWRFKYKTVGFYWIKTNISGNGHPIGTGYWTRANPETCLLGTTGHPKRVNADVRKLIESPRREHSRKPDEIYDRIERLCEGPYLEVFARQESGFRLGWDVIGNQTKAGERRWRSDIKE